VITGYFGGKYASRHPFVRVSIHLPGITADYVPIDFLIDTGASNTCLHPQDSLGKIVMDPAVLRNPGHHFKRRRVVGIGGAVTYLIHEAHYLFHHDDGTVALALTYGQTVDIAPITGAMQPVHSLLGMDLLRYFKIRMDHTSNQIILEV